MQNTNKSLSTLHLICGLPGSGKTTLSKKIEAETGAIRFCPDEWIIKRNKNLGQHEFHMPEETLDEELDKAIATFQVPTGGEEGVIQQLGGAE